MASEDIVIRFIVEDKNFKRQVDGTTKKLTLFEKTTSRANRAFASFAGNLAANAVSSALSRISNGFLNVIKDTAEFEQALAGVAKTTNLSGQELQALGKEIQDIGRTLPVATVELLNIAQIAAQLGVRGSNNIKDFTDTVARLAITTDLTAETAALSLAKILNLTNENADQSQKLGAVIVELGNNFATLESNIVANATEIGRAAVQFNLASEEVVAISTALSAVGVPAEVAGSSIGRAFQEIQKAITNGGRQLQNFVNITGLSADELQKRFAEDSLEVFVKFVNGAKQLQTEGQGIEETLSSVGLSSVRLTKTLAPLIQRNDLLADAIERAKNQAVEQNALFEESRIQADTLKGDFQLTINAVERLNVAFGNLQKSSIREFLGGLNLILVKLEREFNKNSIDPYIRQTAVLEENVANLEEELGSLLERQAEFNSFSPKFDSIGRAAEETRLKLAEAKAELETFKIEAEKPSDGLSDLELQAFEVTKAIKLLNVETQRLISIGADRSRRQEVFDSTQALIEQRKLLNQQIKDTAKSNKDATNSSKINAEQQISIDEQLRQKLLDNEQKLLIEFEKIDKDRLKDIQTQVDQEFEVKRLAIVNALKDAKAGSREEILLNRQLNQLKVQETKRANQLIIQSNQQQLNNFATNLDSLSQIAALGGKKAFKVVQGLQLASAVTSGIAAVQGALAAPPFWPLNAPQVLALTARTATNVAAIANQRPSFQQGGIVPGTSFSGDNVVANVNSAEMILNRQQQAQLFNMANGGSGNSRSQEIVVHTTVQLDGEAVGKSVSRQVADGLVLGENI